MCFDVFLTLLFLSIPSELIAGIVLIGLCNAPMITAILTKFHLWTCIILAFFWVIFWAFGIFGNGGSRIAIVDVVFGIWTFGVPFLWLVPAIAGRKQQRVRRLIMTDPPIMMRRR